MTTFSASASLRRIIPELDVFLQNVSQDDPAGSSLRYDPLYDEVRLARQEDDPRLSMGIWKTDLKRADWDIVENLCIEALTTRSKDLQIGAWLTEAWTSLDGIEGYIRGIQLLSGLSETFWKTLHPQPQDDEDMESRQMIFEWMDAAFSTRLMLVPLTQSKYDQSAFGLGYYKSAQHSDASQRRAENTKNTSQNIDPSKVIGTLEEFQRSLDQTAYDFISKQQQSFGQATQVTQTLKDILSSLLGSASPSFSQILSTLKEMERILTTNLKLREPPPPPPEPVLEMVGETDSPETPSLEAGTDLEESPPVNPSPAIHEESVTETVELKTREDAYRQLEILASFLEEHDPHSLAPQLLRQLVRWQNRSIVEILGEIAKTPEEYDTLMKILGSQPSEE